MYSNFDDGQDLKFDDRQGERLREHLEAFRMNAVEKAARPEWFWSAQRATIRERVAKRKTARALPWALVSALVLVALAASLLMTSPTLTNSAAPATASGAQTLTDDDALMRDVLQASYGTVPDALAPATLLANEVDRGLKSALKAKGEKR